MRVAVDYRFPARSNAGIAQFFRPLFEALLAAEPGHEYLLFTEEPFDVAPFNRIAFCRNVVAPGGGAPHPALKTLRQALVDFPAALDRSGADAVVSPYYDFLVPRRLRGRALLTVHDLCYLDVPECYSWKLRRFHRFLLERNLPRAGAVATVSRSSLERLQVHFPRAMSRVAHEVVYNSPGLRAAVSVGAAADHAVDLASEATAMRLRERFNLGAAKAVLYTGGFESRKNLPRLIQAVGLARSRGDEFRLLITGAVEEAGRLMAMIREQGLEGSVIPTGALDGETFRALHERVATAAVTCSLCEGFGRSALEAASVGLPLLCSDIPVFHETVGDYPVYCDPHDVGSMAEGLAAVLGMSRRVPIDPGADPRFDPAANAEHFITLVRRILEGKHV